MFRIRCPNPGAAGGNLSRDCHREVRGAIFQGSGTASPPGGPPAYSRSREHRVTLRAADVETLRPESAAADGTTVLLVDDRAANLVALRAVVTSTAGEGSSFTLGYPGPQV